jgi:integrase
MATPNAPKPAPKISYTQFLKATNPEGLRKATRKQPKAFWYCRTPAGWRYLPDSPAARVHPGRAVIRQSVNGKRVYTPVKSSAAPDVASALAVARRRALRPVDTAASATTLATVIDSYIENRTKHGKLEAAENARVVLKEFRAICSTVQTVRGISEEHITQFCAALRDKGLTDRTVSNKYNRLRSFLKFAKHDVKLSKDDRPKYETTVPTIYKKSETDALLKHADDYMRVAISMGLQLGLREQELMHAEYSDFNHEDKTFLVQSKPAYGFKVKDKEQRNVPVQSALLTLIEKWKRKRKQKDGLVLGIGAGYTQPNGHLLRWLQRVAKRANVKDATLHKMRRYYVTTLLRSGYDLSTVQRCAGHSDLASTMRYLTPASAKEMQSKFETIVF